MPKPLVLALCVASFAILAPPFAREAAACQPDPCQTLHRWSSLLPAHDRVSRHGVFVFHASTRSQDLVANEEALSALSLSVETMDGQVIEGTLEFQGEANLVLFRPAAPLPSDTSVMTRWTLDADVFPDDDSVEEYCGPFSYPDSTFQTLDIDPPSPNDLLERLELVEDYVVTPSSQLDDLVCCDDAMPHEATFPCAQAQLEWSEGFCTQRRGNGWAQARIDVDDIALPEFANLIVRIVGWEEQRRPTRLAPELAQIRVQEQEPFDARLEVVSLVSGDVVTGNTIRIGEELVLGETNIDPRDELARVCNGQAYVCETVPIGEPTPGDRWDPDACQLFGDQDDDQRPGASDGPDDDGTASVDGTDLRGCSCRVTDAGRTAPLWLLALGFIVKRRRRTTCGVTP